MTKTTKREKEIKRAYNTLLKHNISVFTLENKEFFEEWIFEQWQHHNLKPTAKNMKRVREKTMEYILSESWEIMQDAIEYVASKQSNTKTTK
jgi:N-acetylglutamate synthase-like GNAT family acetyltransferase